MALKKYGYTSNELMYMQHHVSTYVIIKLFSSVRSSLEKSYDSLIINSGIIIIYHSSHSGISFFSPVINIYIIYNGLSQIRSISLKYYYYICRNGFNQKIKYKCDDQLKILHCILYVSSYPDSEQT